MIRFTGTSSALDNRISRQPECLEFVPQDLSWMHRPHPVVYGHRFNLLVIVHDRHLAGPIIIPPETNPPSGYALHSLLPHILWLAGAPAAYVLDHL